MLLMLPGLCGPPRALVLCVEPGGRAVVESGVTSCGTEAISLPATASQPAAALRAMDDCCGPCTDLPIRAVQLRQPAADGAFRQLVEASATALAVSPVATGPPAPTREPSRTTLAAPEPLGLSIHSTHLRC